MLRSVLTRSRAVVNASLLQRNCASSSEMVKTRYTHLNLEAAEDIAPVMSETNANAKQLLNIKVRQAINRYKTHDIDTGSPEVQIAVLTEKITNLARHFHQHKKDFHSRRGYEQLISRRKGLMKYLRRTNFDMYRQVVLDLHLEREALAIPL